MSDTGSWEPLVFDYCYLLKALNWPSGPYVFLHCCLTYILCYNFMHCFGVGDIKANSCPSVPILASVLYLFKFVSIKCLKLIHNAYYLKTQIKFKCETFTVLELCPFIMLYASRSYHWFFMPYLWALCYLVCASICLFVHPSVPLQVKVFGWGSFWWSWKSNQLET